MDVFVAYADEAKLKNVMDALNPFFPNYADVSGGDDHYAQLFRHLWDKGEEFAIVEHDVIPWPGALEDLARCPESWCAYGYVTSGDLSTQDVPPLGCVKFRPEGDVPFEELFALFLESQSPGIVAGLLPHWSSMDNVIARSLRARGWQVHEHKPGVAHLHPLVTVVPRDG